MPRTTYDFGQGASVLPGAEVIGTFDPLVTIPGASAAVLLSQDNSKECLVRWYPQFPNSEPLDIHLPFPTEEKEIEAHIQETQLHLQVIHDRSDGLLLVPSHRTFVADHPLQPGMLATVSVVEKVAGRHINHNSGNIPDPGTAATVFGLARYLEWVVETRQPKMLADNFKATQTLIGPPNYMVDIDGAFMHVRNEYDVLNGSVRWLWDHCRRFPQEVPAIPETIATVQRIRDSM